jgi:hypothetical protein
VRDGRSAGQVARFEEVSAFYGLVDLPPGFIRFQALAAEFEPVEQEIATGTELPREVVLTRTAALPDCTHQLSGMVPVRGSSNTFFTDAKVETRRGVEKRV